MSLSKWAPFFAPTSLPMRFEGFDETVSVLGALVAVGNLVRRDAQHVRAMTGKLAFWRMRMGLRFTAVGILFAVFSVNTAAAETLKIECATTIQVIFANSGWEHNGPKSALLLMELDLSAKTWKQLWDYPTGNDSVTTGKIDRVDGDKIVLVERPITDPEPVEERVDRVTGSYYYSHTRVSPTAGVSTAYWTGSCEPSSKEFPERRF